MNVDVSVVMPLYNAKNYLKYAVDSVLNQTLKSIEVVIVDDCSTDGSLDLCRELYGNDPRVRLFRQDKNGGPGAARNRAIAEAKGEYIAFIDSDDEMLPDNLRRMFETAKKHDADFLHNNQIRVTLMLEPGALSPELLNEQDNIVTCQLDSGPSLTAVELLTQDLAQRLALWKEGRLQWSVCNKMVRRSLIVNNGLFFPSTKLAEDTMFCLQCLLTAKNYVLMPGGWYIVRRDNASLTRGTVTPDKAINIIKAQLQVVKNLQAIAENIPFLKEQANFSAVVNMILKNIEDFSLRFTIQDLGTGNLRKSEITSEFFRSAFGENSPYVEFLFFQLHETYPEIPKPVDTEASEKLRQAIKAARAEGKEFVLKKD